MGFRQNLTGMLFWTEPAFIKRMERRKRLIPPWFHIIPLAIVAVFVLLQVFFPFPGDPPWAMPLIGVVGGLLSYALPVLDARAGALITVDKDGVSRLDSLMVIHIPILYAMKVGVTRFGWDRVGSLRLLPDAEIAGRRARVLELCDGTHGPIARIGLPPEQPTMERLSACLAEHGRGLE